MRVLIMAFGLAAALSAPKNDGDTIAQAAGALHAGHFQAACEMLRPAARQLPNDANVWNMLGICESELNRTRAAKQAFQHGLAVPPASISLLENLGLLFFREADYPAAKHELQRAVSLGSSSAAVAFSLAECKVRTHEERAGWSDLKSLEPQLSNQPAYWSERGWVEVQLKEPAAAASFERALALAPDDVRASNGAASLAEAGHNDEKALSLLVRARKAHPDDVTTLLHLGSVCRRRDLIVDAVDSF